MYWPRLLYGRVLPFLLLLVVCGCSHRSTDYPLNPEIARESVRKAMQAWADGKAPPDLKPEIIIGDTAWDQGTKLASFEILSKEETTDGSNLHISVLRKFGKTGAKEAKVTYIVGTSPVITIFPQ